MSLFNKTGIYLLSGLILGVFSATLIIVQKPSSHNYGPAPSPTNHPATPFIETDDALPATNTGQALNTEASTFYASSTNPSANQPSEEVSNAQQEMDRLRKLNAQLQSQLAEILSWMLANYKGRYPLAEHQITNLSFHAVSDSFGLNPAVAEFMHLQSNEVVMINDLLSYGGTLVNDLVAENISVTESESGKVVLHIPPFQEEGALLREDVYSALEATLGPYRFDRFMDITAGKMDEDFNYFGDASHTIIIEPIYTETDDGLQWRIRDGWIILEEDSSKTIKATETVVRTLPEEYDKYVNYLPAYLYSGDVQK